jgi:hypothetical protein
MATGLLSRGITLHYDPANGTSWVALPDLQEIPEMGAVAEKVEVTTLADTAKKYINGIKDYGELVFKFLYANGVSDSYKLLAAKEAAGTVAAYKVTFPDNTTFVFSGFVSCKIDSAAVNAALTFSASIALNTAITIT